MCRVRVPVEVVRNTYGTKDDVVVQERTPKPDVGRHRPPHFITDMQIHTDNNISQGDEAERSALQHEHHKEQQEQRQQQQQ